MDATSGQEVTLRVTGYTSETKKFIEENPAFASIPLGDVSAPVKPITKKDLPAFICLQVLPTLMENFSHYKDSDELLYEFGLFNSQVIDKSITADSRKKGIALLKKVLAEVE